MEDKFQRAITKLTNNGIKITDARKLILEYIINTDTHPTAYDIFNALKKLTPNISLATIYNSLEIFVEQNIVISIVGNDQKRHYDFFLDPHYHVVCESCGMIWDADNFDFTTLKQAAFYEFPDFKVTNLQIKIFGMCSKCRKNTSDN